VTGAEQNSPTARPTIAEIKKAVCARKGLTIAEIECACRARRFAYPRQVAMSLARELTGSSLPKIGRHFGKRDHTTVLWADRKVKRIAQANPDLEIALDQLRETIMQMVAERPAPPPLPPEPVALAIPEAPAELWKPQPPKRIRVRREPPRLSPVLDREAWASMGGALEFAA